MNSHFLTFDKLIRELKSSGCEPEEEDIAVSLLLTLPEDEFESVILSFAHVKSGKLKLAAVKSCLLDIKQRHGGRDETVATLSSAFKANAFKPNSCNNFRK